VLRFVLFLDGLLVLIIPGETNGAANKGAAASVESII
jgi:hypothetical protein